MAMAGFIFGAGAGCGLQETPAPVTSTTTDHASQTGHLTSEQCSLSYSELQGTSETLSTLTKSPLKLATRDAFVSKCIQLPATLGDCLRLSYQLDHQSECQNKWNNIPAHDLKALQKLSNLGDMP